MLLVVLTLPALAQDDPAAARDVLRAALDAHSVTPLEPLPAPDPALFTLGEALFFDRILSGNQDTACATCHHPLLGSADGRALGLGTGNSGLGPARVHIPGRMFIARHAPDLFNRGQPEWRVFFWDGRVMARGAGGFDTPAGDDLPAGITSLLEAQTLFPVAGAPEMRGFPGDSDIYGAENALALLDTPLLEPDYPAIWAALLARLLDTPAYADLFAAAYPDTPPADLTFAHAARALAVYQAAAFDFRSSPFDRFLAGEDAALTPEAVRGGLLFFGEAGCARCHTGPLLTDQAFHNVAVPQLGPGMEEEGPLDHGRARESGRAGDLFAFRTPPLRHVALTAPYMHNGAYATLEGAVRHMLGPEDGLRGYDPDQLIPELAANLWDDPRTVGALLAGLDPRAGANRPLTEAEISDLLAFLHALTDPAAADLAHLIPESVPSGLPVDR